MYVYKQERDYENKVVLFFLCRTVQSTMMDRIDKNAGEKYLRKTAASGTSGTLSIEAIAAVVSVALPSVSSVAASDQKYT